ncbi:hypothetical protein B0H13DRAFT_2070038 [Mycena leptocephala]|nr:hypothetical protein B0H13DRAFT_2070038 [Mycena leptocephala]
MRETWGPPPKTLLERKMYELSWALRIKPDWQRKAKDPLIQRKWREEAIDEIDSYKQDQLTKKMIDYVLDELDGYAKIADNDRGIERAHLTPYGNSDRLFSADKLVSLDWHPGSNGKVLDLVHPSLYCIVYGRTHAYLPGKPRVPSNFRRVDPPPNTAAKSFMFSKPLDGSVKLVSPYIKIFTRRGTALFYPIIEDILSGFIHCGNAENGREPFVNSGRSGKYPVSGAQRASPGRKRNQTAMTIWRSSSTSFSLMPRRHFPEANRYTEQLEAQFSPVSLRGRNIQCIVKFANIQLTPETRNITGEVGTSKVFIHHWTIEKSTHSAPYYDEDNIDESNLSFRVPTGAPDYHDQDDFRCVEILYGITMDDSRNPTECVQNLGHIVWKGRALAWPNLFQHCVISVRAFRSIQTRTPQDPRHLPRRSYHRPNRVATGCPAQQAQWATDAVDHAHADSTSHMAKLPQELADMEAKEYRLNLMKERTVFEQDHTSTAYTQTFNMCEH